MRSLIILSLQILLWKHATLFKFQNVIDALLCAVPGRSIILFDSMIAYDDEGVCMLPLCFISTMAGHSCMWFYHSQYSEEARGVQREEVRGCGRWWRVGKSIVRRWTLPALLLRIHCHNAMYFLIFSGDLWPSRIRILTSVFHRMCSAFSHTT